MMSTKRVNLSVLDRTIGSPSSDVEENNSDRMFLLKIVGQV